MVLSKKLKIFHSKNTLYTVATKINILHVAVNHQRPHKLKNIESNCTSRGLNIQIREPVKSLVHYFEFSVAINFSEAGGVTAWRQRMQLNKAL